jgi:hypothetical protein
LTKKLRHYTHAADPLEGLLLQDAQQLGLRLRGEFAHLVEEDGAVVGQFEAPLALRGGAREGALLVTEQSALDQLARPGGAALTINRSLCALRSCRARAINSLPVPVSPISRTLASVPGLWLASGVPPKLRSASPPRQLLKL